ncbi:MAG: hypothetical protein EOP51_10385, partial [Sphingobacteriales bacterium]
EGIWKTEPYTIGIIKKDDGYVGFILDGGGTAWQKNQIKIRMKPNTDNQGYTGEFYLRNYYPYKFVNAQFIGANTLIIDRFALKRVNPKTQDAVAIKSYIELIGAQEPLMQQYSANTLVLRIPSFDGGFKKQIDSVLAANHDKIISTKNLVIDVRNNGGGSDGSYQQIMKYLYTNPIRIVTTQMYSTPLNNKRMEGFLNEPGISENEKAEITAELKKLNDNLSSTITSELERYSEHISRVEIFLADENGAKAGVNDKRCTLEARVNGREPIAVTAHGDTVDMAFNNAIDKLHSSLATVFDRMHDHHK